MRDNREAAGWSCGTIAEGGAVSGYPGHVLIGGLAATGSGISSVSWQHEFCPAEGNRLLMLELRARCLGLIIVSGLS